MRTLIIGGDGRIGAALKQRLPDAVATTRRSGEQHDSDIRCDLADLDVDSLPEADVVYLCAANTSLRHCHDSPRESSRVNTFATAHIGRHFIEKGSFVVFLSTNLVLPGRVPFESADTPRCPTTEYGRQKASAEVRLLAGTDRVAVVRLTKIVTPDFCSEWRRRLADGNTVVAFDDLTIAPVTLDYAVEAIAEIGQRQLPGLWQVSGQQELTYYTLARNIARTVGADNSLVCRARAIDHLTHLNGYAPRHSSLDTSRVDSELRMADTK